MTGWVAALLASVAVLGALPPAVRVADGEPPRPSRVPDRGWVLRWRALWSVLAAVAVACFVSGPGGLVAGVVTAVVAWVLIGRTEPADVRRRRARGGA